MQLRFGGSGFKYTLKKSYSTYWVNGTQQHYQSEREPPVFLEDAAPTHEFKDSMAFYLKRPLSESTASLIALVHILFENHIRYVIRNGVKCELPASSRDEFERSNSLKAWF